MPNSPISALFYLILLVPGIAYVKVTERHRASLKLSTFRETANIVFASVVSLFVVSVVAVAVSLVSPPFNGFLIDVFQDPVGFFERDPILLVVASLLGVSAASLLAMVFGLQRVQEWFESALTTKTSIKNHWSGWIAAFEDEDMKGHHRLVSVTLKDGSWIQGVLKSYSAIPDDTGDRALVLYGFNKSSPKGSVEIEHLDDQFVVIQADQIAQLSVVPFDAPADS